MVKRGRRRCAPGENEDDAPDQIEKKKISREERADGIKTNEAYNRVEKEFTRRLKIITKTELNQKILMKAINTSNRYCSLPKECM